MYEKMQALGLLTRRSARVFRNPPPSLLDLVSMDSCCEFSSLRRGFHSAAFFSGTISPQLISLIISKCELRISVNEDWS